MASQTQTINEHEGRKYLRTFRDAVDPSKTIQTDIYGIIEGCDVRCPARAHAIKKLLASGQRGKGDAVADLIGVLAAVNRAIELQRAREGIGCSATPNEEEFDYYFTKEVYDEELGIKKPVMRNVMNKGWFDRAWKVVGRSGVVKTTEQHDKHDPDGVPHWKIFLVKDGPLEVGYRVGWSEKDQGGNRLFVRHYLTDLENDSPSLAWCKNAAERQASQFNDEKKLPADFGHYDYTSSQ